MDKSNFSQIYIRHNINIKFGLKRLPKGKRDNFEGNHKFDDLSREICTFPFLPAGNSEM